jgi:hypothetical protein
MERLHRYLPKELVSMIDSYLIFPALDKRMINEMKLIDELNNGLSGEFYDVCVGIKTNNLRIYKDKLNLVFERIKELKGDREERLAAKKEEPPCFRFDPILLYCNFFEGKRLDDLLKHQVCEKTFFYLNRIYENLPVQTRDYYENYLEQQHPSFKKIVATQPLREYFLREYVRKEVDEYEYDDYINVD